MAGMGTVCALCKPVITHWMLVISALMALMILGRATTVADTLEARVTWPWGMVRASHERECRGCMPAKGGSVGQEKMLTVA
jgi:hypothetical protein